MKKTLLAIAALSLFATAASADQLKESFTLGSLNVGVATQDTSNVAVPSAGVLAGVSGVKQSKVSWGVGASVGAGRVMSRTETTMHAVAGELMYQRIGNTEFGGIQIDYLYQPSFTQRAVIVPHVGASTKVGGTAGIDMLLGLDEQNHIRVGVNFLEKPINGTKNYAAIGLVHVF